MIIIQLPSKSLDEEPEVNRPVGRCKLRWQNNIKMDLKGTVYEGVHWNHATQDRDPQWVLVKTVMILWIP
jgi:hypothetical protein